MEQWLSTPTPSGFGYRNVETGIRHGWIRWRDGNPPTPYGCRWCGTEQRHHGRRSLLGRPSHIWERPTQAQIKARMLARRNAFKAKCRCVEPWQQQPFAPVVDPWKCEADDCRMHDHLIGAWLTPLSFDEAMRIAGGERSC